MRERCTVCGGRGEVPTVWGPATVDYPDGVYATRECGACEGEGQV